MPTKIPFKQLSRECKNYLQWSATALLGNDPVESDRFLNMHMESILKGAKFLLNHIGFKADTVYRGIILRNQVAIIEPHKNFTYLCFSTERSVAEHFADVNGFGSEYSFISNEQMLGKYGYVITYKPKFNEVLFHHHLLDVLPYKEVFDFIGRDGEEDVNSLKRQKEVTILQPDSPFTDVTRHKWPNE